MGGELLDFLGNFVNYMIFIYIFVKTVHTPCFSVSDMSISIFGLSISVFIFVVNMINKKIRGRKYDA